MTPAKQLYTRKLPDIAEQLRNRIIEGRFERGERLPSCRALARDLKVSHTLVHRALGTLTRDGFVAGRQTRGTFVTDQPPHLFRYGIVFQSDPSGGERGYWPPSWRGLNDLASRVQHIDPRRQVVPYYNINDHKDVPDYQRLLLDLRASRLAGLIFPTGCHPSLFSSPLFADLDLPRVMLYVWRPVKKTVSVLGDLAYITRGLDYLASRGRKRVAVLDIPGAPTLNPAWLRPEIEQRGMTTRTSWMLPINAETRETAQPTTELLMSLPPDERPDGLFIANPFLVEHATAGVVAADVRVPKDLDIVAAADFPVLMRASTPVKWVGDDLREGLYQAIMFIDEQRRTGKIAENVVSTTRFEEELSAVDPLKQLAVQAKPADAPRVGHNEPREKL